MSGRVLIAISTLKTKNTQLSDCRKLRKRWFFACDENLFHASIRLINT